ncbi:MAG: hypothetical protein D6775_03285 [Caldilineae bacterium]|nr:MAG: hypothetical protein D6775_03285 [Caldilineae bacterium]
MRTWRIWFLLVLVSAVVSGCSIPAPPCDLSGIVYPSGKVLAGGPLRLGVIDASPVFPFQLPGPLAQTQADFAVLDDVRWGLIEPQPPQNGFHTYQWDDEIVALDTRVQAYQSAGFQLVMVLRAWNTWARAVAPQGGLAAAAASTPPKPEFLADYSAWVAAVVERYDADGVDDFAGLQDVDGDGRPDPVRYYQIETEAVSGVWWQGTTPAQATTEYLALLRAAAAAARGAYPEVKILLAGIPALDMLDGFPTAAGLQDVVTNIDPAVCGAITAYGQLLAATDAYDIAAVHSLADYTGLQVLADWVRTLAGRDVPVWLTGATSAPALLGDPPTLRVNPLYPTSGQTLWNKLQNAFDPDHARVESWYRQEQARLAFKKWVYAAWLGFDALTLAFEQDRFNYQDSRLGLRDLAFQGLLDDADGFSPPAVRPVVRALALAQGQLRGFSSVQKIQPLAGENVEAFLFRVEGLPVYVLWYDDHTAQGPDDPPVSTQVQLRVRAPELVAMTVPTRRDQTGPDIQVVTPVDGVLTLNLTETPVILRGEWTALYLPQVRNSH